MKTKAVIFDMDGVLFDTQRVYVETWERAALEMNLGDISNVTYACIGRNRNNIEQYLRKSFGDDFAVDEFYSRKDVWFDRIIEERGTPVKPGVKELLEYLKENEYKIALATSTGQKRAFSHLYSTDLFDYFDIKVTGNMVKCGKPDPEIYLTACKLLRENPKNCFAVEDSYNGVRSASSAGTKTIMIPDMLEANVEMRGLCYCIFDSMNGFLEYLKTLD